MLKSYGVGGACPCDFSVSPSPFGLDFGTLDSDFGLGLDNSDVILRIFGSDRSPRRGDLVRP